MGRADDAMRYATELLRFAAHAPPVGARAFAGHIPEGAPQSAQALPACLEGDFGNGQVGVAPQRDARSMGRVR